MLLQMAVAGWTCLGGSRCGPGVSYYIPYTAGDQPDPLQASGLFEERDPAEFRSLLCVPALSPGARDAEPVPGWFAVSPDTAEAPAKPLRTAGSSAHTVVEVRQPCRSVAARLAIGLGARDGAIEEFL
jgi:hypothetical protein